MTTPDRAPSAPVIDVREPDGWYARVKPVLDAALSLVFLAPALALIALAAVAIKLTSPGPILYTQTRLGRGGRPYTIWKLRTMRFRCEARSGARWSTPGDSRVTAVGRLLRATHIDELPQLWNVLRGEMSLVGPRPERPELIAALELERRVPGYPARLLVRPGVTGLAQLQLPPDTDVESVRRKVAYDLYYIRRMGLGLDLRLLLGTVLKVARGRPRALRAVLSLPHSDVVEAILRTG
ncbi:sugar transferase [Gemmata massiliana]|nr:sugar transferase [Gemmata massiliana]